jgi:putative transposase
MPVFVNGGMDVSNMTRLRELEEENRRLKAVYAESTWVANWLLRLAYANGTRGFGLCFLWLRNVKGMPYNHKRVYHICHRRNNTCQKLAMVA